MIPPTRLFAAATDRNRQPIADILLPALPPRGTVLEIASGTGQHTCFFAVQTPHLTWQPSDPDAAHRVSITAWKEFEKLDNVLDPLDLDVHADDWQVADIAAMVNINMIHIAPITACQALMRGAQKLLAKDALLYLYGPFRMHGEHTAPSNAAFDASLRARDETWGLRDLEEVVQMAKGHGMTLVERADMPSNNMSLLLRRS